MKTCRICLQMDVEVSRIGNLEAIKYLQDILIKQGFGVLDTHNFICVLCKHHLSKFHSFVQRVIKAQNALNNLITENGKVQSHDLRKLRSSLFSCNLSCKRINNYYVGNKRQNANNEENFIEIHVESDECSSLSRHYKAESLLDLKTEAEDPIFGDNSLLVPQNIICESNSHDTLNNVNNSPRSPIQTSRGLLTKLRNKRKVKVESYKGTEGVNEEILNKRHKKNSSKTDDDYDNCTLKATETCNKAGNHPSSVTQITLLPTRLRNRPKNKIVSYKATKSDDEVSQSDSSISDDDFSPEANMSEDDSSDLSEEDLIDDNGKLIKQPLRVYPITCEECDYEISSSNNHRIHYLTFHRDKEYPYKRPAIHLCKFCGIKKSNLAHLKQHELTHGERTFKCDKCGKMFANQTQLYKHSRVHDPPSFECDYCHKKMHFKSDLMLHIRTHTGEKPFKCHICGDRFAHKGNVAIHIRNRHTREPPKKGGESQATDKQVGAKKKVTQRKGKKSQTVGAKKKMTKKR